MFTDILQKLILLIVGVLFLSSLAILFIRFKNVNRAETTRIFKSADYFNA